MPTVILPGVFVGDDILFCIAAIKLATIIVCGSDCAVNDNDVPFPDDGWVA